MPITKLDCPDGKQILEFRADMSGFYAFLFPKEDMDDVWPNSYSNNAGIYLYVGASGDDSAESEGGVPRRELYLGYARAREKNETWNDRVKEDKSIAEWKKTNWKYTLFFTTSGGAYAWTPKTVELVGERLKKNIEDAGANDLIGAHTIKVPSIVDIDEKPSETFIAQTVKNIETAAVRLAYNPL